MKRKFQIDGIGCSQCVVRIKRVLEEHPAIENIEVFLIPRGIALIKMKEHLSIDELQNQLDNTEGFTISEL